MSKDTGAGGGPVATSSRAQQQPPPLPNSPPPEILSSRRLRIDEIKERRRRFHKETAERWILEQQFGAHGEDNNRDAEPVDTPDSTEKPDRNSFINAFEFFARGAVGGASENGVSGRSRISTCESEVASSGRNRVSARNGDAAGRNLRLEMKLEQGANSWRHSRDQDANQMERSPEEESPPSTSSSSSTSPQTDDLSSSPEKPLPTPTPPLSSPPLRIRKKPSIPDILVIDPIVIISGDSPPPPSEKFQPIEPNPEPERRRPSSILKKRDSTNQEDSSTTNNTTVSFACVDPEEYELELEEGHPQDQAYRRRSRSYSGSSTNSSSRNPRRRNSAEPSIYSSTEEVQANSHRTHHGILKHSCSSLSVDANSSSDSEFKSILKQPALRRSSLGSNIHTIHNTRFSDEYDYDSASKPNQRSILKRKSSTSSSQPDVSTTSSLRSTASSYCSSRESLHEPEPKPILKKKSSSEEISDSDYNSTSITPPPPRPILKNKQALIPSSENIPILLSTEGSYPIKPCLKKPCKSFDESTLWSSSHALETTSSIMRKSSPHICEVKKCEEDSILPSVSLDEETRHKNVLFRRRDSEPLTSPIIMDTEEIKRKLELGKIDFSGFAAQCSSNGSSSETSPSSGISSPPQSSGSPKKSSEKSNAISQKIAALQISGESSWKKRVSKLNPEVEIIDGLVEKQEQSEAVKKPGILANRLSMLESSQESWRKRVGEKDAKDFTVQGKLERAGKKQTDDQDPTSPVTSTPIKKKSTSSSFKNVFRGIRGSKTDESIVGRGEAVRIISYAVKNHEDDYTTTKTTFQRSKSMRYGKVSTVSTGPNSSASSQSPHPHSHTLKLSSPDDSSSNSSNNQHVTVPVMKNDNETFTSFFSTASGGSSSTVDSGVLNDDSFNSIVRGEQLLGSKRKIKVARKERGVKNPIKALAGRINEQSYTDVNPEIRERENIRRRIQMENATSTTHAHLSIEALAGLASKLDYTSVKLRRAQQEINAQYPYPILIRVKGKRFVQTRLAAPEISSLNSGDNFILITQTKLYHFIGEYSNRMERSKSLDVVAHIVQKKEFGCNLHTKVITLNEETAGGSQWESFFEVLGTSEKRVRDDPDLLGDEVDEEYESKVIGRNKVWRVVIGDELDEKVVPVREYWGIVPKYKLLESSEVLIFDFGPEMYVWSGSKANVEKKRLGYRLAQSMFEMEELGKEFEDVNGAKSKWRGWLRKVNQHMEPILFIEKFFDWPEEVGRIRVGVNGNTAKKSSMVGAGGSGDSAAVFVPVEANALKYGIEAAGEVSLVLEGFDVKRGRVHVDEKERRNYTITTTKLQTWAISEFSKSDVPDNHIGHFNCAGTYVIRWQYTINFVGKDLKGNTSKHNASTGGGGRDRCAYFFWHGKRSKITEQGASALMTVELDDLEERREMEKCEKGGGSSLGGSSRGPQIRVEQNYEPPAFLSLFKGKMFIHDNQINAECATVKNRNARLYVTLGADEEEGHFMEVACSSSSFRSNGCFLLFDFEHRLLFLWVGAACPSYLKKIAQSGANHALKNTNWTPTVNKLVTVKQSHETDSFWSCILGEKDCIGRWCSLISQVCTVEFFRFSSINGKFEVIPVVSPRRCTGVNEPFPVVQEDLYGGSVSQPSMFLILSPDNTVYLWQGWRRTLKREFVPDDEPYEQAVDSTPLTTIWPKYRRCSIETALNYARAKGVHAAYLVYAGIEPQEFTHIFGYWDYAHPSVREAHDYHIAEGKRVHEKVDLQCVLDEITAKRTYTVEELMEKPEGVDLMRLEDYLSDEDFERLFSMPREQFSHLQPWRKTELKKAAGLF